MSSNDSYCYPDECRIKRAYTDDTKLMVELLDANGNSLWCFPEDWTDEQIMIAIAFANHAYAKGVWVGEDRKVIEIKKVLGF